MQSTTAYEKPSFYIFLDIDGVLLNRPNNLKSPPPGAIEYAEKHAPYLKKNPNYFSDNYSTLIAAHYFSPKALANLDALIQKIENVAVPKIVISSIWRHERSVEELREIYFGMHSFARYIVDKTAKPSSPSTTAKEIQQWLEQHADAMHFVIFDDHDDDLQTRFNDRYVHVSYCHLLTEQDVAEALKHLPNAAETSELLAKMSTT